MAKEDQTSGHAFDHLTVKHIEQSLKQGIEIVGVKEGGQQANLTTVHLKPKEPPPPPSGSGGSGGSGQGDGSSSGS